MMLYEQVQAYDELDMSVMRLRERLPDEPVAEAPQVYIIERPEVKPSLYFKHKRIFKLNTDMPMHCAPQICSGLCIYT